jgi:hypothetical protein
MTISERTSPGSDKIRASSAHTRYQLKVFGRIQATPSPLLVGKAGRSVTDAGGVEYIRCVYIDDLRRALLVARRISVQ